MNTAGGKSINMVISGKTVSRAISRKRLAGSFQEKG